MRLIQNACWYSLQQTWIARFNLPSRRNGGDAVLENQDPNGYDPTAIAYMIDWNHSDNSLIRFQINQGRNE